MPSHSDKQRRKMGVLHREGKITDRQWEHFKHIERKPNRSAKKSCGKKRR